MIKIVVSGNPAILLMMKGLKALNIVNHANHDINHQIILAVCGPKHYIDHP